MSRRIIRRPEARRDAIAIGLFIAQDNPAAGRRFMDAVEEAYQKLAGMPRMGTADDLGEPDLAELRRWPVPRFRNYLHLLRTD